MQRLRLEKAAAALVADPDRTVLAVALDHGFGSAATFARAFRARFGMTATAWRAGGAARWRRRRKPGKQVRKPGKASARRRGETAAMSIEVRDLPAHHVACMRYVGPYGATGIPALWRRFNRWMDAHGLRSPSRLTLGVAWDDPGITAPGHCRYDACVVVPPDFQPDRLVDLMEVRAGRYAVARFAGSADQIVDAWDHVFAAWLPGSGWAPDDRPCYELYRVDCAVVGRPGHFRCELCLPVRPL